MTRIPLNISELVAWTASYSRNKRLLKIEAGQLLGSRLAFNLLHNHCSPTTMLGIVNCCYEIPVVVVEYPEGVILGVQGKVPTCSPAHLHVPAKTQPILTRGTQRTAPRHPPRRRNLQERRAIRENPAVIPKIGAFFVHDDRSGGASGRKSVGGGKQQQQQQGGGGDAGEESPEEEEVGLGRWRADALPSAKKYNGGEQR